MFSRCSGVLVLGLALPFSALAEGISTDLHPSEYCYISKKYGYPTRPYNKRTDGCASEMTSLSKTEGRLGLPNNLAYYVMGDPEKPSALLWISLILNINAPQERAAAQAELARVANGVADEVTGFDTRALRDAILDSLSGKVPAGAWTVELETTPWKNGYGITQRVRIFPTRKPV